MNKCYKCGSTNILKETDWLRDAEETVETFYCKDCHIFLGVGNTV